MREDKILRKFFVMMLLVVFALSACGQSKTTVRSVNQDSQVEDCDLEDTMEGDEDCYGVDLKKKKKKSPSVKFNNKSSTYSKKPAVKSNHKPSSYSKKPKQKNSFKSKIKSSFSSKTKSSSGKRRK